MSRRIESVPHPNRQQRAWQAIRAIREMSTQAIGGSRTDPVQILQEVERTAKRGRRR